jgi:hypothetical protein
MDDHHLRTIAHNTRWIGWLLGLILLAMFVR